MTTPSKLDEARLRELAEAATPGPWQNGIDDLEGIVSLAPTDDGNVVCLPPDDRMELSFAKWPANAAFIAAASPVTMLALLKALSEERAVSQRWHDAYSIAHDQATENGQRASAERERADRAVGLIEDFAQFGVNHTSKWVSATAQDFLATQKAEGAP